MAEKIGDVVFRRTDLGTGGHPGEKELETCADLMASELGWNAVRVREEINEVRKEFLHHHSTTIFASDGYVGKVTY
jgi:glycerol-3-phosphate dehydrogenase